MTYVHQRSAKSRTHHEFHAICPAPGTLLPAPVGCLLDCPRCLVIPGVTESSSRAKSAGSQAKGGEGPGRTGALEAATICAPLERSISPFRRACAKFSSSLNPATKGLRNEKPCEETTPSWVATFDKDARFSSGVSTPPTPPMLYVHRCWKLPATGAP